MDVDGTVLWLVGPLAGGGGCLFIYPQRKGPHSWWEQKQAFLETFLGVIKSCQHPVLLHDQCRYDCHCGAMFGPWAGCATYPGRLFDHDARQMQKDGPSNELGTQIILY